jgi:hypothetical protein
MVKYEVSDKTLEVWKTLYPHLTDSMIQDVIKEGEVIILVDYNSSSMKKLYEDRRYVLQIPLSMSDAYEIDYQLALIKNNDGIFFTIRED